MNRRLPIVAGLLLLLAVLAANTFFIVDQRQQVVVVNLGPPSAGDQPARRTRPARPLHEDAVRRVAGTVGQAQPADRGAPGRSDLGRPAAIGGGNPQCPKRLWDEPCRLPHN